MGGGPHTDADLDRWRMALSEVAPAAIVRLNNGWPEYAIGSVSAPVARKAAALAGLWARCDACWTANALGCRADGPPPYAADCGIDRARNVA